MATKANLVIDQGSNFTTTVTITDDDGNAMDLSGYSGAAQIRKHYSSSNSVAFNVAIANSTGEVTLSLLANATANMIPGRYVYDCELTLAGVVSRILEGIVTITPEVTR